MKKVLSILAWLIVAAMLATCLVACDSAETNQNGNKNKTDNQTEEQNNSQNQISTQGKTEKIKSKNEIKDVLIGPFYFEILTLVDDIGEGHSSVATIAGDQNRTFVSQADVNQLSVQSADKWKVYNGYSGESLEYAQESIDNMVITSIDENWFEPFLASVSDSITYTSKKDIQFCGRDAIEYENVRKEVGDGMSSEYKSVYVIDKLTGICMKSITEMTLIVGEETDHAVSGFQLQKAIIGESEEIHSYLDAQQARIQNES